MKKGVVGVLSAVLGSVAGGLAVSVKSNKEVKRMVGFSYKH